MQKSIIRGSIAEALTNSGDYEALSRNDIDELLKEYKFQDSGMVNDEHRKELGKMSGAELLCIIRATSDKDETYVEASLIDVESGKIVRTATGLMSSKSTKQLREACMRLAAKLVWKDND
jgi:uncharacterized protein YdaT